MKKVILFATYLFALSISGCPNFTDNKEAVTTDNKVRIESSDCNNCGKCETTFICPFGAIKGDSVYEKRVIDASKCSNCGLCLTKFKCKSNAITRVIDILPPDSPEEFKVIEKSTGEVECTWFYSYDDYIDDKTDNGIGNAYGYSLYISKVPFKVIQDQVKIGDDWERKIEISGACYNESNKIIKINLKNLSSDEKYYYACVAYDEAGNQSIVVIN